MALSDTASGSTCHATLDGAFLVLGNTSFQERWHIAGCSLRLDSFSAGGGKSWVHPTSSPAETVAEVQLETQWGLNSPCETPSLVATLTLKLGAECSVFCFQIFPGIAGSILRVLAGDERPSGPAAGTIAANGLETDSPSCGGTDGSADYPLAPFTLVPAHLLVTEVQFTEQTDLHANFVTERTWLTSRSEPLLSLKCNLASIEDPSTGEGFVLLMLGPTRFVRDQWTKGTEGMTGADFLIETTAATDPTDFTNASFAVRLGVFPGPYPLARIAYTGGTTGRTAALHQLQRALHAWSPERDGLLISNTWGDRSRADKINEAFLLEEIRVGKELGTEVVQIDDGWQKGRSANTVQSGGVWNGFWASDPTFWEPDPERFPQGLAPVAEAAKRSGLRLGLWYAPDSSKEFAHWEKDAAMLIRYWRELGIAHYKLDAVKLHTRVAEQRFLAMLDRVHGETEGRVLFDLDATAEYRETYFGHPHGSTVFLENRYTDWGNYYPHQTLRALWTLAHYIWPPRIRLEFLNSARNDCRYHGDPLRPAAYPPETLFAITMAASPLAFLENSGVPTGVASRLAALIQKWKQHRDAWYAGNLQPIGECPNGWTCTGFSSLSPGKQTAYLLVFRELNPAAAWEGPALPLDAHNMAVEVLAGDGTVTWKGNQPVVQIPERLGFIFARIQP